MKFSIKYLAALIGIVSLVSCAQDDIVGSQMGENMTVKFLLKTDSGKDSPTRAINDGKSADLLYYAIFSESGEVIIPKTQTTRDVKNITTSSF